MKKIALFSLLLATSLALLYYYSSFPDELQGSERSVQDEQFDDLVVDWSNNFFIRKWLKSSLKAVDSNPVLAHYVTESLLAVSDERRATPPNAASEAAFSLIFPQFADGLGAGLKITSTVIVINNGGANVSGTISLHAQDGEALTVATNLGTGDSFPFSLLAGEVLRLETTGTGNLVVGWAEVTSDLVVSGSGTFTTYDASGNVLSEVGIGASSPSTQLMIFIDTTEGKNSGFAICNPDRKDPAGIQCELRNLDGSVVETTNDSLPSGGQTSQFITEAFGSTSTTNFRGSLVVVADRPVSLITLRTRGVNFTSLPGVPVLDIDDDPDDILFARIGDGKFGSLTFQTSFILLNNSEQAVSGELHLTSQNGQDLKLRINGTRASLFPFSVPAGGALEMVSDGSSNPGVVGWARAEPNGPLAGGATFTITAGQSRDFLSEVGVPNSPVTGRPEIYAQESPGVSTGLAISNPLEEEIELPLTLYEDSGGSTQTQSEGSAPSVWQKTIRLAALSHIGVFLFELFPDVPPIQSRDFRGRLEMESYTTRLGPDFLAPVTGITLLARGTKLTSVPMAPFIANFGPRVTVKSATLLPGSDPSVCFVLRQQSKELPLKQATITFSGGNLDAGSVQDTDQVGIMVNKILGYLLIGYGFAGPGSADMLSFYNPVTFDGIIENDLMYTTLSNRAGAGFTLGFEANSTVGDPLIAPFSSYICIDPGLLQWPGEAGSEVMITEQYLSYEQTLGQNDTLESTRYQKLTLGSKPAVRVESITPSRVIGGQEVTVQGIGFHTTPDQNKVTVEGVGSRLTTEVLTASAQQLRVHLPDEIQAGPLTVEIGKNKSNDYQLDVPFSPSVEVSVESKEAGENTPVSILLHQDLGEIGFWKLKLETTSGTWIHSGFTVDDQVGTLDSTYNLIVKEVKTNQVVIHAIEDGESDATFIIEISDDSLLFRLSDDDLQTVEILTPLDGRLNFTTPVLKIGTSPVSQLDVKVTIWSLPERTNIPETALMTVFSLVAGEN